MLIHTWLCMHVTLRAADVRKCVSVRTHLHIQTHTRHTILTYTQPAHADCDWLILPSMLSARWEKDLFLTPIKMHTSNRILLINIGLDNYELWIVIDWFMSRSPWGMTFGVGCLYELEGVYICCIIYRNYRIMWLTDTILGVCLLCLFNFQKDVDRRKAISLTKMSKDVKPANGD